MLTTLNFMSPSGNVTLPPLTIFWVASWMSQNFFKLNENKTEIIAFCPKHSSNLIQSQLGPLSLNQATKNLGVMFDAELCFDAQVRIRVSTVKSPKLDLFLSHSDLHKVLHAFIFSRLDYCNGLHTRISQGSLHKLQMVQNAAARI